MDTIGEIIRSFFATQSNVVAVYVYGSQIREVPLSGSDIDIAILLDDDELDQFLKIQEAAIVELGRLLRKVIHPVCMNIAGEELLKQIFLKGNCVLVKDAHHLSRFRTKALTMIAEYGYYLKMFQNGIVKSVMESSRG